jgi:WD40 repeat protein
MIEGEEIFESAQETGYRLCRAVNEENDEARDVVFSASWDLNNPTRLLVCLANGQLKAFDIEEKTCDRYKVLFRRYSATFDMDSRAEKLIEYHWDKMTTIPDRPDELILLLGVSRTLMYTALPPPSHSPYPEQPLLASTARGDIPGFIFGSPIMEISAHNARITALAVSPAGHILASGDEVGNVKLLLLRLLDEISVFKQNERRRKKQQSASNFSKFLPTYNVSLPAHDGPIFCLQWLPIIASSGSNNVRSYALVTGSIDRTVRIWRVTCSSSAGITMTPAMNLDTLTTHVLSLNAYLYTDRYLLAKFHRLESLSTASTPEKGNSSFRFNFANTDTAKGEKSENGVLTAKSIFLAAGTSVGMVYVWKVSYVDLLNLLTPVEARVAPLVDDGTRLYSLLQASDRPVINVTLAAFPFSEVNVSPLSTPSRGGGGAGLHSLAAASAGDIVLAASDTAYTVHIFTPEKLPAATTTDASPAAATNTSGSERNPLLRVGEQAFSSPVVCCSFPPAYPNPVVEPPVTPSNRSVSSALAAKVDRWDPSAMVQMNGPLLLAAAHGELMLYSTDDLSALSYERQRTLSGEFALADPQRRRTASTVSAVNDADSVDSVDSQVAATDRLLSRKSSMRKQNEIAKGAVQGGGASDDEEDAVEAPEQWETLQVKKTVRLPPPLPPQQGRSVPPRGGAATATAGPASGYQEEPSEYPRTAPPPVPTAASSVVPPNAQRPVTNGTQSDAQAANGFNAQRPSTRIPTAVPHPRSHSPAFSETDASTRATSSAPTSPSLPSPPKLLQERIAANRQRDQEKQATTATKVNMFTQPIATYSKVRTHI